MTGFGQVTVYFQTFTNDKGKECCIYEAHITNPDFPDGIVDVVAAEDLPSVMKKVEGIFLVKWKEIWDKPDRPRKLTYPDNIVLCDGMHNGRKMCEGEGGE